MKLRLSLSLGNAHRSILFNATVMEAAAMAESLMAGQRPDGPTEWVLGTEGVTPYWRGTETEGTFADAMELSASWFRQ